MAGELVVEVSTPRQRIGGQWRRAPWAALLIVAMLFLAGVLGPLLTPYGPLDASLPSRLQPPAWSLASGTGHLLGTDTMGRDLLTRLVYGARITLEVVALTLLLGAGIGVVLGILSGYLGGWVDNVIMRAVDITLSFPAILFALLLAVVLGPSLRTAVLVMSLVLWARFARIIRGEVLSVKERDFVAQARVNGCSSARIMVHHIFPNTVNTFMVLLSLNVGWIIIVEASLSFLGAGIPPPTPSWGQMVSEGKEYINTAWWVSFFPGMAIALVVLAFNLFGDWLRDTLDPKLRQV